MKKNQSLYLININFFNKKYFFKHFRIEEMLELEEFEKEQLAVAKKSGIKTQTELLKDAKKYGSWTQKEEDKIESLNWTIKSSLKILDKMSDPMTKKTFQSQIDEQQQELNLLEEKKNQIASYSAEALAQQKRLSKMILNSLFYDKDFKDPIIEKDIQILGALIFSKFSELANKNNILKASYNTYFFEVFMSTANCLDLFKVKFMDLTIFQKNLISYSRALLNKIQNTQIPEKINGDPVKMFNYEAPKDGEEKQQVHGTDDLKRRMKARGGELKAEDFLE